MKQKTIIGIEIPAMEETSEGQLRGGFTDLSMSPGDMTRANTVCGNNDECEKNVSCFNNGECEKDFFCFGNNNPTTTTTTEAPQTQFSTISSRYGLY